MWPGDFTLVLWVFLKHPLQPASFIHKGTWPAIINYFFANQTYTTNHYFVFLVAMGWPKPDQPAT
jgi:hypothetical protein